MSLQNKTGDNNSEDTLRKYKSSGRAAAGHRVERLGYEYQRARLMKVRRVTELVLL